MNKVNFLMDSINKNVSIDYENELDLIDCFTGKSSEIAAVNSHKICLIALNVIPEEWIKTFEVTIVRQYSPEFVMLLIPSKHVKGFRERLENEPGCKYVKFIISF
jgi:hypothetical protein